MDLCHLRLLLRIRVDGKLEKPWDDLLQVAMAKGILTKIPVEISVHLIFECFHALHHPLPALAVLFRNFRQSLGCRIL